MKWLALLLCVGCASSRIPSGIQRHGGFYQPWTAYHTAHRDSVLACLGLSRRPAPSLWISRGSITLHGVPVWAYYDKRANAVVFAGTMPVEAYWFVFRHEMIHAADRKQGHGAPFARAVECGFWPIR